MRFIQIWIMPAERGLEPGVEQKVFTEADRTDRLLRAISGDGGEAVLVHQDAHVFVSRLNPGVSVAHALGAGPRRLPLRDRRRRRRRRRARWRPATPPRSGTSRSIAIEAPLDASSSWSTWSS